MRQPNKIIFSLKFIWSQILFAFFIRFVFIDFEMKKEISRKIGKRTFFATQSSENFKYLCPRRLVTSLLWCNKLRSAFFSLHELQRSLDLKLSDKEYIAEMSSDNELCPLKISYQPIAHPKAANLENSKWWASFDHAQTNLCHTRVMKVKTMKTTKTGFLTLFYMVNSKMKFPWMQYSYFMPCDL